MKLTNHIFGYDMEGRYGGNRHYENFKHAGRVAIGSVGVTLVGVVLEVTGVSFGHEVTKIGEVAAIGSSIYTIIEARLPLSGNPDNTVPVEES